MTILIILIVLALLGILGAVIKGLLWLALIAIAFVVAASAYGYFKVSGFLGSRSD